MGRDLALEGLLRNQLIDDVAAHADRANRSVGIAQWYGPR